MPEIQHMVPLLDHRKFHKYFYIVVLVKKMCNSKKNDIKNEQRS